MSRPMTPESLGYKRENLPKWAKGYMDRLEQHVDTLDRALAAMSSGRTQSPVYIDRTALTGEFNNDARFYLPTRRVCFELPNLEVEVTAHNDAIYVTWHSRKTAIDGFVQPRAGNSLHIVERERHAPG